MTTSNSTDFNPQQQALAREVLERLSLVDPEESIEAAMLVSVRNTMNYIIKSWQNDHTFLHTRTWTQKTFTASSEVTGSDGNIYTCILSHTSSASNKPVTGANYAMYWTQKGDTGGVWVTATSYSAIGDFTADADTTEIEEAFVRDGGKDYAVSIVSMNEYLQILDKTHTGRPYLLAFDKQLSPKVYLHYQPDLTTYVLHYLRTRKIEDFDGAANTADLRPEQLEALIATTAYKVAPKFNKPLQERLLLKDDMKDAIKSMFRGDAAGGTGLRGAF